jgi:putative addiction module component (TIGR02574 family)
MATELQLDQMTIEEKLQLVDQLWLSRSPELEQLDTSLRDRELLDERWAAFLKDTSSALTLKEFQQRMGDSRKRRSSAVK